MTAENESKKLRFFASDIETTGFLEDMLEQGSSKRMHNFCKLEIRDAGYKDVEIFHPHNKPKLDELAKCVQDANNVFIMHNAWQFDIHALEMFGIDTTKSKFVDTLPLSWYLHLDRERHGLEWWGEEFGIPKPKVDDWQNLTQDEYDHRVLEDCKIQRQLWMQLCNEFGEIYGCKSQQEVYEHHAFKFFQFKAKQLSEQMVNKWKLDVDACEKLEEHLSVELSDRTDKLLEVLPDVPTYAERKRPVEPFKKNGELSEAGKRWKAVTEAEGYPFDYDGKIKVVTGYKQANPNSTSQIKSWLDSLGWIPSTFEFKKDADGSVRKIPQVGKKNSGGLVCESVEALIEDQPNVSALVGLGITKHRLSMTKGWLRDQRNGYLEARASGLTNTFRMKHSNIVNVPSGRVPYGKELRSCLIARDGCSLVGSDLSALENNWKFHYQMPLDPKFVNSQMSDDFDPHLALCVVAELLTKEDMNFYKIIEAKKKLPDEMYTDELVGRLAKAEEDEEWATSEVKRIGKVRAAGKAAGYALQYGSGVETLARAAKVTIKMARKLKSGYDKLNWTIPKIAAAQKVKSFSTGKYLWNKVSKMWYPLKAEKDRFSTLIQGSGAYTLDLWLKMIFNIREEAIASGRIKKMWLLGQFHDEVIFECFDEDVQECRNIISEAMAKVNDVLKLNVPLGCDIKHGKTYYDIH